MEPIDLNKVCVFVRIAEIKSFTRAAGQLAIAQSALSRKMRDLESDLGVQLFHRNGRGVALTEAGERFLARAKLLLSEAEGLVVDMRQQGCAPLGTVRIGLPPTLSCVLVTPLVIELGRSCPEIKLQIIEGFSGDIRDRLLNGDLDLGLLHGERPLPTLFTEELHREDMFVVGPAKGSLVGERRIRFADVARLPLVLPGRPHGIRVLIDDASARAKIDLRIHVELTGLGPMKGLIEAGLCYGILPSSAVSHEVQSGRMTAAHIEDPTIGRTLVLAMSNQRATHRATEAVAQHVRTIVHRLVGEDRWGLASPRQGARG